MDHERKSQIARNVASGVYAKIKKFANYGSVVEDSIKAQQRQADRRLLEIQAKKVKAGCNIINGLRYQEMRDIQGHLQTAQTSSKLADRAFSCSAYNIKGG
jgi:hypothetical protein